MNTSTDFRPTKYVAKWLDEASGLWFETIWSDLHKVNSKQVEIVRRGLNRSFESGGVNAHVRPAMGSRTKFVKCRIINRTTRKLVFRSK